jgi:rubredoxin
MGTWQRRKGCLLLLAEKEKPMSEQTNTYVCDVCGHEYDEAKEGKKWEDLPMFWLCPECGCHKDEYQKV